MEFIRSRIETQLMSLTGLSLGQLDLENPKGDPGLFGQTRSVGKSMVTSAAC